MSDFLFRRQAVRKLRAFFFRPTSGSPRLPKVGRPFSAIECLESRIAPANVIPNSSIGTGLNKTSVSFLDADGDYVQVSLTGGGHFDISLDGQTNAGADIDNIKILNATSNSSLTIDVTSRGAGGLAVTPGFTNVNSITSAYTGILKSINLNSTVVQDIELGGVTLSGGLTLDVANAMAADAKNQRFAASRGLSFTPITSTIDLNTVTLGAADSITIRGAVSADKAQGNDFNGAITVAQGLNKLIGTRSALNGSLTAGTFGGAILAQLNGALSTTGDMTLDLQQLDQNASVNVGGDLNLRLGYASGCGAGAGLYGHVQVAGSVSGLKAGAGDPINIRGGFAGILTAGGDIASLALVSGAGAGSVQHDNPAAKGQFNGVMNAGGNIGNISAQQGYASTAFIAANGSIGDISSQGTNSGTFAAGGTLGNILADVMTPSRNALDGASFAGQGGIGTITAKSFNGIAMLHSTFQSELGNIGATIATVSNLTGGDALLGCSYSAPSGTVNGIQAFSAGGSGIDDLQIRAAQVTDLTGAAGFSSGGSGIHQLFVNASNSIGNIDGEAFGSKGADGMSSVTLLAGQSFNAAQLGGSIGNLTGNTAGTGYGITGLTATAQSHLGQVTGVAGGKGQSGMEASALTVIAGDIAGVSGVTSGFGDGLAQFTLSADSIGTIVGTATGLLSGLESRLAHTSGGHGIVHSSFSGSSIGPVTAVANHSGSPAIEDSSFMAGAIGMITATGAGSYGILGGKIGDGSSGFHYSGITSNGSVSTEIDTTGGAGSLGVIAIGGDFLQAQLGGVDALQSFAVGGAVTGKVGAAGEVASATSYVTNTITIGDEARSSVVFTFDQFRGAPSALIGSAGGLLPHGAGYSTAGTANIVLSGLAVQTD